MTAEFRAQTPPPRRRGHAAGSADRVQQQVWSATPGTGSPVTEPKDQGLRSPQPTVRGKHDSLLPLKVNEEVCFSSPKPDRGTSRGNSELGQAEGCPLLDAAHSPAAGSCGKENMQPVAGEAARAALRAMEHTPMKTPTRSRLPTVQEDDGQAATSSLDEMAEPTTPRQTMPAWVVQSPTPAAREEPSEEMQELRLRSPVPPGLENVFSPPPADLDCDLPKPTVKGTFIQFTSPLKTFAFHSPPKSCPPVLVSESAPVSLSQSLFGGGSYGELDDGSPAPWFTHDQIPFFPSSSVAAPAPPPPVNLDELTAEPRHKGPVVRLSDFLPEPSAQFQPQVPLDSEPKAFSDQAPCFNMNSLAHMLPEAGSAYGAGFPVEAQQQWQMPQQQMPQQMSVLDSLQLQDPHAQQQQAEQMQQMQAQFQQMQQLQQMQQQMQQMQAPQMQAPQMQAPQMQAPQMGNMQMQPPQMQPPQMPPQMPTQMGNMQMQTDNIFLQQLMQMQMQPPSWAPMQAPLSMAGEHMPAPPQQMAMCAAAPSALCPSTCHQAQVCRCGEATASSQQQLPPNGAAPSPFITLSAAMFPEMGNPSPPAPASSHWADM